MQVAAILIDNFVLRSAYIVLRKEAEVSPTSLKSYAGSALRYERTQQQKVGVYGLSEFGGIRENADFLRESMMRQHLNER